MHTVSGRRARARQGGGARAYRLLRLAAAVDQRNLSKHAAMRPTPGRASPSPVLRDARLNVLGRPNVKHLRVLQLYDVRPGLLRDRACTLHRGCAGCCARHDGLYVGAKRGAVAQIRVMDPVTRRGARATRGAQERRRRRVPASFPPRDSGASFPPRGRSRFGDEIFSNVNAVCDEFAFRTCVWFSFSLT